MKYISTSFPRNYKKFLIELVRLDSAFCVALLKGSGGYYGSKDLQYPEERRRMQAPKKACILACAATRKQLLPIWRGDEPAFKTDSASRDIYDSSYPKTALMLSESGAKCE